MRGVYVCRALSEDRLTGSGAEIYSLACAAARGGHDVYLVSETLAGYRTVPRGPVHVPVAPPREGHRYLAEPLAYADRVYDALRALHLTEPLDRIEFVAAEGFTAIRAKRLLGEFAGVRLVVSAVGPGISPAPGLRAAVTAHAEGYCRRYADEVVTERPVVTAGGELLPAGPAASGPPTEVWFIGASPVEASALTPVARELRPADVAAPPPRGTPAVLDCSPAVARLALALGLGAVAFAGSECASVVAAAGGAVVPRDDPAALAAALRSPSTVDFVPPDPVPRLVGGPPPARPVVTEPELVSVVIPVRDQGGYLPDAIESAWRCGYRPLEVIVVDDGSTEAVSAHDCTVLRLPHRGLPAARNAGIAAARGRYVVPLDADDLLPAGFVGAAVGALRRHPDIGAVAGTVRNFGLLEHVSAPVGYVPDVSLVVNTFARATAVFRASALAAVGGYDETLPAYEDWDLYLRLHKAGFAVECAPVVGQLYRRHEDSMTFRQSDAERVALVQRLLAAHADLLTPGQPPPLLLTLVDLWKHRYEPSASVAYRREPTVAEVRT